MNKNTFIAIIIIILIGLTTIGLSNDIAIFVSIGHIFILPMIGVWYGFKRQWQTSKIDIAVYLSFFVGSFSDSLILLGGQTGEILQISMTFIMHTILIIIFRKEGTRIYTDKLQDLPKLLIPILLIFVFFGAVMIPILPNIIYFIAIFYAIQEMVLVSHGWFRQVKGKSFIWVAVGVSLVMVKDVLYCYNFFIYQNKILPLYIIQYTLSAIVYFMIAVGIALNQDNKKNTSVESLGQYIKNHIKLLFNFHHLTLFERNVKFGRIKVFLIYQFIKRNFSTLWSVLNQKNKVFLDELE